MNIHSMKLMQTLFCTKAAYRVIAVLSLLLVAALALLPAGLAMAADACDQEAQDGNNAECGVSVQVTIPAATVDKSALEEAVEAGKSLIESDYTDASWETFKTKLSDAQTVLDNDDATQDQVDAALASLKEAQDNLVKKSGGSNDGNSSNGSSDSTGTGDQSSASGQEDEVGALSTTGAQVMLLAVVAAACALSGGYVLLMRNRINAKPTHR